MIWFKQNSVKLMLLIIAVVFFNTDFFCQSNKLRGTVKVRKKKVDFTVVSKGKIRFTKRENPLSGKWTLANYEVDGKVVSLDKNSHILEFYDSSYHFRRIYSKPISRIFEGSFPVDLVRNKLNSVEDTLIKFKVLNISDYHLFYVEDSLVFTDLVEIRFEKFTYSPSSVTFIVKELDEYRKVVRTLFFRYRRLRD